MKNSATRFCRTWLDYQTTRGRIATVAAVVTILVGIGTLYQWIFLSKPVTIPDSETVGPQGITIPGTVTQTGAGNVIGTGNQITININGDTVQKREKPRETRKAELPPTEPEMVHIPGGTFQMGCSAHNECSPDERPTRRLTVAPFYLGKYEVTLGEFHEFVKATNYKVVGGCWTSENNDWRERSTRDFLEPGFEQTDDNPIVCVNWQDASAYTDWLSKVTDSDWRLPTEVEWEYAARAGAGTLHSWGNDLVANEANCLDCGSKWDGERSSPVGSFPANKFGLHDMHGNVWEWVNDWYRPYQNLSYHGDRTSMSGLHRVARGGGWHDSAVDLRSSVRKALSPEVRNDALGFRVVKVPRNH